MNLFVARATPDDSAAVLTLLDNYAAEIQLLLRDEPGQVLRALASHTEATWLARLDGQAVGIVRVQPLAAAGPEAAECKRLYVLPKARGQGVADALMEAAENHAAHDGYRWLYLDSKDDLAAAIRLYLRRGYQPCARYNANPQATVFLRRQLHTPAVPADL